MQYMPLKSLFYFEVCQTVLTYLPSTKFQVLTEFKCNYDCENNSLLLTGSLTVRIPIDLDNR